MDSPDKYSVSSIAETKLDSLPCIAVQPYVERFKLVSEFEYTNKYLIFDPFTKKQIYYAEDATNYCLKVSCANSTRSFDIIIYDEDDKEFLYLHKSPGCTKCCFPCAHQRMTVSLPSGRILGSVKQYWSPFSVNLGLKDARGRKRFRIRSRAHLCFKFEDMIIFKDQAPLTEQVNKYRNKFQVIIYLLFVGWMCQIQLENIPG